uniref:Uncharacterized protein n=1 Tax=Lepeophtheirus salmonis TaxID=72036 RepID=A0A0K2VCT8_LEPSM
MYHVIIPDTERLC